MAKPTVFIEDADDNQKGSSCETGSGVHVEHTSNAGATAIAGTEARNGSEVVDYSSRDDSAKNVLVVDTQTGRNPTHGPGH